MPNKVVVPSLILLMLVLGIIFCVWRRGKNENGKMGMFQIIRVRKNNKEKEEASDEKKESNAAGS